jgi:hypothetical protein
MTITGEKARDTYVKESQESALDAFTEIDGWPAVGILPF